MKTPVSALALTTILAALPAVAEERASFALGPHQVTTAETEDYNTAVLVDGEKFHEDAQLLLDGSYEVGDIPAVVGVAGAGGNSCNAAPFVISLRDGKPTFDGPIESCEWFTVTLEGDHLRFASDPLPGVDAEVWHWHAEEGFSHAPAEAFSPDPSTGWADLDKLAKAHPSDALKIAPAYAALSSAMSQEDWSLFTGILAQLGSGDLTAEGYAGSACHKAACDAEFAYLFLDRASERPFALWTDQEGQIKTAPARADFPAWVETYLGNALPK